MASFHCGCRRLLFSPPSLSSRASFATFTFLQPREPQRGVCQTDGFLERPLLSASSTRRWLSLASNLRQEQPQIVMGWVRQRRDPEVKACVSSEKDIPLVEKLEDVCYGAASANDRLRNTAKQSPTSENVNLIKDRSTVLQCLASTSGFSEFRNCDNFFNGKNVLKSVDETYKQAGSFGVKIGTTVVRQLNKSESKTNENLVGITKMEEMVESLDHKLKCGQAVSQEEAGNAVVQYTQNSTSDTPLGVGHTAIRLATLLDDSHSLFDVFDCVVKNGHDNVASYDLLISGLLQYEKYDEALNIYGQKFEKKTLHRCNKMLSHLSDSIRAKDAVQDNEKVWRFVESILGDIQEINVKPNVSTFTSLMYIASRHKNNSAALCVNLLNEMRQMQIQPSLRVLHYFLQSMNNFRGRQRFVLSKLWLHGILYEIEDGKVDMRVGHEDDKLFFGNAMHIAAHSKSFEMGRKMVDIVMENNLAQDQHVRFFNDYLLLLMNDNSTGVDKVISEYKRFTGFYEMDGYSYERLFMYCAENGRIDYFPELYSDCKKLYMNYFTKLVKIILSCMTVCRLPSDGRLQLLNMAEHAWANGRNRQFTDVEYRKGEVKAMLSGMLYLYCVTETGSKKAERERDQKIADWLDVSEEQYGVERRDLVAEVFRTCLIYNELGGALRASESILGDETRRKAGDMGMFGQMYMRWRLTLFRREVPISAPKMGKSSPDADVFSNNRLVLPTDIKDVEGFRSRFYRTIQNLQASHSQ